MIPQKGDIIICKEQYNDPDGTIVFFEGERYKINETESHDNLNWVRVVGERGRDKLFTTFVHRKGTNYFRETFTLLREERKNKLEKIFLSR